MPKIIPTEEEMDQGREFIRGNLWHQWRKLHRDQKAKVPPPLLQKPYPKDAKFIDLIKPEEFTIAKIPLINAIRNRKSRRFYNDVPLTLEELSFLLWGTQGVHQIGEDGVNTKRTVPSGGSRHPFETYLYITLVEGLQPGLYRYLALEHKLIMLRDESSLPMKIEKTYIMKAPVVFIWSAIPYRSEWRYSLIAHKLIAQDSGHLCQNLYLACEGIGAGACAYGYFHQQKLDEFIGVDGKDEFAMYVARVGKVNPE